MLYSISITLSIWYHLWTYCMQSLPLYRTFIEPVKSSSPSIRLQGMPASNQPSAEFYSTEYRLLKQSVTYSFPTSTQSRAYYTNAWPSISWAWCLLWWVFLLLSGSQGTLSVLKLQIYRCKWPTGQDLGRLLLPKITCFESSPSWELPSTVPLGAVSSWPSFLVSHSLGFCFVRISENTLSITCLSSLMSHGPHALLH